MVTDVLASLYGTWGLAGSLTWSFARSRRAMLAVQISAAPGFILHWVLYLYTVYVSLEASPKVRP